MKNINHVKMVLPLALCFYIVSGCSKSSSANNQCNFSTGSGTAASGAQVVYSATGTGSVSLSSVTYKGASGGDVVVSNPSLPWSASINFPNGGSVGVSAVGTASNGGLITLTYGISSSGSFSADTASCGH
jgi:hypothetical protein